MISQEEKKKAEKSFFLLFFFFQRNFIFSDGGNWLNSGGEGLK